MKRFVLLALVVSAIFVSLPASGQGVAVYFYTPEPEPATAPAAADEPAGSVAIAVAETAALTAPAAPAASAQPVSEVEAATIIDNHPKGRFRWGADVGGTIDLTGQDASSYDISMSFGFTRKWINFLGFGAKAAFAVSNSNRAFPLFVNFRTNFKDRPSIVFWDVKGGVALNYPGDNRSHAGAYASTGVGFYLARSSTFSSHILLAYTFRQQDSSWTPEGSQTLKDLHMATLKIGVMF